MKPEKPSAFTLAEVLVSLAIFALGAVILGAAYVNVLVGYQKMQGSALEESDLAVVRATILTEPKLENVEKGGEMRRSDNTSLRWKVEVEPTDRADLFRVNLDCELTSVGNVPNRHRRDTFLVLRPTWSDPTEREKLRTKFREELQKRKGTSS